MASDDHLRAEVERAIDTLQEAENAVEAGDDFSITPLHNTRLELEAALESHRAVRERADALIEYFQTEASGIEAAMRCGPLVVTEDGFRQVIHSQQPQERFGYRPLAHYPDARATLYVPVEWDMRWVQ